MSRIKREIKLEQVLLRTTQDVRIKKNISDEE